MVNFRAALMMYIKAARKRISPHQREFHCDKVQKHRHLSSG